MTSVRLSVCLSVSCFMYISVIDNFYMFTDWLFTRLTLVADMVLGTTKTLLLAQDLEN